jgi:N-acetylated-alpha-linked acidic dipeptidase
MDQSLLDAALAQVDGPRMMRHLEAFARRVKLSGTAEELENVRYLQACLDGFGYRTELILHPSYISLPGKASIQAGDFAPRCITHSFSRPSGPGGVRGSLLYLKAGRAEDFAGQDVRGRILLLDGIANPAASLRASQAGALGQVHVTPHEHLHEMCISPVWGNPTPQTLGRLPTTTVLTIAKADGDVLKARLTAGEDVQVTLHAEVDTGWRQTPILQAELMPDGAAADVPFVLFSGHQDTWYYGVMDNGGANATMLEVARILAERRADWRRGLRLCFWSGHSHGRYSGSTWYADNRWLELDARCAAHVNVDSTGARGNTVLADVPSSSELQGLARAAVRAEGGQDIDGLRMGRAGDQSFWGIGVPSMYMGMGEQPVADAIDLTASVFGGGTRKGAGFGWWWHTPDDTLDKMDADLLVRDTRIYVHTISRLLTDRILPLDYAAHAGFLLGQLATLQAALGARLDLSPLVQRARAVQASAEVVAAADPRRADAALMAASRALVPMDYTQGDRFDHDPALGLSPVPVLDPIRQLAALPAGSEAAAFAEVAAVRARNRLAHALDQAAAALAGA